MGTECKTCRHCAVSLPATVEYFRIHSSAKPQYLRSYCKKCDTDRHRAYVDGNRDRIRAHAKRCYDKTRKTRIASEARRQKALRATLGAGDEYRKKHAIWRTARLQSPENVDAERERWRRASASDKGRARSRVSDLKRRARKLGAEGDFTKTEFDEILRVQGHRCYYCHADISGAPTADHYIPLSRGGAHGADNIVAACKSCNCKKNNRMPSVFMLGLGDKSPQRPIHQFGL